MIRMEKLSQALDSAEETCQTKRILQKNLYQISPINKSVNRDILSLAYSPGVGEVCLEIKQNPKRVDQLTLRGRSVAIVSDGSMLNSEGKRFMPVMDWFVAQMKYFGGVDSFPFVIKKQTNLEEFFKDISTTYGTVLYLDNKQVSNLPENILFLNQQEIAKYFNQEITDASQTALIASNLIQRKVKGVAIQEHFIESKNFKANNFTNIQSFENRLHDSRSLREHAVEFHQFYKEDPYSKTRTLCAIVTDGTAILGLGNIGPVAGLPVMEGKSLLFKSLGDVDVVPFCIFPREKAEQQITVIDNSIGNFRAVNLQDIKAPECFIVERGMKKMKNLPVFHDDQHGTAIVLLAGLITALKLAKKQIKDIKFLINGAGAAGSTISRLILDYGAQGKNMIICDSKGAIYKSRKQGMNSQKDELASITNLSEVKGSLQEVIDKADVFIGVSVGGALKKDWIKKMNANPIIFALANPNPEILPEDAKESGAFIYASGRSDFENQINNSLVFPGIFKGIIKHNLAEITDEMKLLAAKAISQSLTKQASVTYIIPDSLDRDVTINIAEQLGKLKK